MGYTSPCCSKKDLSTGLWSAYEDQILSDYIKKHGEGRWNHLSNKAGLNRTGKSCRLRWLNYLRPGIKRGNISPEEEELIVRLHRLLGNRWSLIAGRLPGRTDNEVRNYWNTVLRKKVQRDHSLPLPPFSTQNHLTSGSSQCEFQEEQNKQDQQSIVMRLQQPPEAGQLGAEAIGEPSTIVDLKATEPESCKGLSSSFTIGEEEISSSKLTELWSSDLLNSDFSSASHFQDGEADTNTGYNYYLDCELYLENEDDWNWR